MARYLRMVRLGRGKLSQYKVPPVPLGMEKRLFMEAAQKVETYLKMREESCKDPLNIFSIVWTKTALRLSRMAIPINSSTSLGAAIWKFTMNKFWTS